MTAHATQTAITRRPGSSPHEGRKTRQWKPK
jgi:hypothetical protein